VQPIRFDRCFACANSYTAAASACIYRAATILFPALCQGHLRQVHVMATLLPPPQYDVTPPMPVIERVLPLAELQRECMKTNPVTAAELATGIYRGCSAYQVRNADGKIVSCTVWYTAGDKDTLRHERAHCAGWPKDHPGGR
jgi:hypothetical protein